MIDRPPPIISVDVNGNPGGRQLFDKCRALLVRVSQETEPGDLGLGPAKFEDLFVKVEAEGEHFHVEPIYLFQLILYLIIIGQMKVIKRKGVDHVLVSAALTGKNKRI